MRLAAPEEQVAVVRNRAVLREVRATSAQPAIPAAQRQAAAAMALRAASFWMRHQFVEAVPEAVPEAVVGSISAMGHLMVAAEAAAAQVTARPLPAPLVAAAAATRESWSFNKRTFRPEHPPQQRPLLRP